MHSCLVSGAQAPAQTLSRAARGARGRAQGRHRVLSAPGKEALGTPHGAVTTGHRVRGGDRTESITSCLKGALPVSVRAA